MFLFSAWMYQRTGDWVAAVFAIGSLAYAVFFYTQGGGETLMAVALRLCVTGVLLALLSSCASIVSEVDPPKVTLESFNNVPGEGGAPRFEIKLRIANPNKQSLDIAGISYSVDILDKELISGVTNEVPLIEGYTEEVVTLEAGLQLFQLLRLLAGLGQQATDSLDYRFSAKIDFNGFVPTQRIEESGSITLQ
jgi:LEA14-like dessication related protein